MLELNLILLSSKSEKRFNNFKFFKAYAQNIDKICNHFNLENKNFWFDALILMFQKEVAERLVAQPGDKAYGRLSILTQWLCNAELKFDVPPQAFIPPPKIISSVVHLIPHPRPLYDCRKEDLETTTTIAFGQRRKMLRASFKKYGGETLLLSADIDPTARPQELSIEAFTQLANKMRQQNLFAYG